MTYCSLQNAVMEARRLLAECLWPAVRILEIRYLSGETRFSPVHYHCCDWAHEYPTIAVINPQS